MIFKNRETPPPSYDEIQKYPTKIAEYQPLPKSYVQENFTVNSDEDNEEKDEYEYVIEKGCFPKNRKFLSKSKIVLQ